MCDEMGDMPTCLCNIDKQRTFLTILLEKKVDVIAIEIDRIIAIFLKHPIPNK